MHEHTLACKASAKPSILSHGSYQEVMPFSIWLFFSHDALSYSKKSKSETMTHAMTSTSPQAKAKILHKQWTA